MHGSRYTVHELIRVLSRGLSEIQGYAKIEVAICPPAVYLQEAMQVIQGSNNIKLGAQNLYYEPPGAYTGEIAAEMLSDIGCQYVIIGHSERRQLFFETDAIVARKFKAAYHSGLIPILCIGETREEREMDGTLEVVAGQLETVRNYVGIEAFASGIIAYEPIWAIGTGLTASLEQAQTVHAYIRNLLKSWDEALSEVRIIYGGSLKADNALSLLTSPDIDGGLVGGASLKPSEFLGICKAAIESTEWKK